MDSKKLHITILSPEQIIHEGNIDSVAVPGEKGRFEVLCNHAPLISSLTKGSIICKGESQFTLEITGGFIEVAHNNISICVEI